MYKHIRRLSLISLLGIATLAGGASLPVTSYSQSSVVTSNSTIPMNTSVPGCNGDNVTLDGTIHVLLHTTQNEKGGFHVQMQVNTQGVTGVGVPSGVEYVSNSTAHHSFNTGSSALPFIETVKNKMLLIAKGEEPDQRTKFTLHVTVNANGTVTAMFLGAETDCR